MMIRPMVIVLACVLGLLPGVARTQEKNPATPATQATAGEPRRVSSFRLLHASAATVVEELNRQFGPSDVRAIADPRYNAVIVLAPGAIQPDVARFVAEQDVLPAPGATPPAADTPKAPAAQNQPAPPPNTPPAAQNTATAPPPTPQPTTGNAQGPAPKKPSDAAADQDNRDNDMVRVVQVPRGQAPAIERALDGLAPNVPAEIGDGNGNSFAVMRISPTTQRALMQLIGPNARNRQPAATQPGAAYPANVPPPGTNVPGRVPVPAPNEVPPAVVPYGNVPAGNTPPGNAPAMGDQGALEVLRVHGIDVQALARTVAAVSAAQGTQGGVNGPIIVVLPRAPTQPAAEIGSQPGATRR